MSTEPQKSRSSRFRKFFRVSALVVIIALVLYYFICGLTYSEGTRSGVLTKISKRGFVFKTFEGDMNIGGLTQGDGTIMPLTIFKFSVRDLSVYKTLENYQGKRVIVHYTEVIHSFFWQGETNYFIHEVTVVQ